MEVSVKGNHLRYGFRKFQIILDEMGGENVEKTLNQLQVNGKKEYLIPFVKSIVEQVNLDARQIKLKLVEGLID